jgi:hypothetical protein
MEQNIMLNIQFLSDAFEKLSEECSQDETPESLIYEYFEVKETENGLQWDQSVAFPDNSQIVVGKNERLISVMKVELVPIVENINYYHIYGVFMKADNEIYLTITSKKDAEELGNEFLLDSIKKFEIQRNSRN